MKPLTKALPSQKKSWFGTLARCLLGINCSYISLWLLCYCLVLVQVIIEFYLLAFCNIFVYLLFHIAKFEAKLLCSAKCNVPFTFKFKICPVIDLSVNTSSEERRHIDLQKTMSSRFFNVGTLCFLWQLILLLLLMFVIQLNDFLFTFDRINGI